jgi:hypothetical protein
MIKQRRVNWYFFQKLADTATMVPGILTRTTGRNKHGSILHQTTRNIGTVIQLYLSRLTEPSNQKPLVVKKVCYLCERF